MLREDPELAEPIPPARRSKAVAECTTPEVHISSAGRWGRVRRDATLLPLRLTHSLLSDLVAARRPTVTSALSALARRGLVRYEDDVWLLSGEPPGELLDVTRVEPRSEGGSPTIAGTG